MSRDFISELKARFRAVDNPKPRFEELLLEEATVKRFNIHKRSLPPGIDKIVVLNVTKRGAEWWTKHILKTKCYENAPDDSKTLIYFDIIPVGARPREKSIYFNTKPVFIK